MQHAQPKLIWIIPDRGGQDKTDIDVSLRTLIARRSERSEITDTDLYRLIVDRAGIAFARDIDIPVAALEALGAELRIQQSRLMRADPVVMMPSRRQLTLAGNVAVDFSLEESQSVIAALNNHFEKDEMTFGQLTPNAWYLAHNDQELLHTTPLLQAVGQDVKTVLPRGKNGARWHAILNEAQMVLHHHSINTQRSADGRTKINSLWLWGNGSLPVPVMSTQVALVGNSYFVAGLANHFHVKLFRSKKELMQALAAGNPCQIIVVAEDDDLPGLAKTENDSPDYAQFVNELETLLKNRTLFSAEIIYNRSSFVRKPSKSIWSFVLNALKVKRRVRK